jgi:hypothetical protein
VRGTGAPPGHLNLAPQAGAPRGSVTVLAMAAEQLPAEHLMPLPESQALQGGDEALAPGDPWPDDMPEAFGHEGWLARLRNGDFPRRFCSSVVTSLSGARRLLETLARRMFTPKNVLKP